MKDYRVTVKVRNNRILKAIEDSGGMPGAKWCHENGLGYARVNNLINMTTSPISPEGTLYPDAAKLCEVLNKLPEDLWSNEQLYPLEKNFSEMEMSHEQVVALLPSDQQSYLPDFSELEQSQTKALIGKALATLNGQERAVIRMRYEDDRSLGECAESLNVSTERIRQIESKALRKLRHPALVGLYVDTVDGVSDKYRAEVKKAAADFKRRHGDEHPDN